MPILAEHIPVPTRPGVITFPDDRRLEFEALDGSDLIQWDTDDWIARAGLTGIDVPPREVIRQQLPDLPGSRLREIRDLEREVFVPLWTRALDRDYRTTLAQLARVRSHLNYRDRDYLAGEGTFDLAAYASGSRRTLRCTYLDGMEGDYSTGVSYSTWRIFGLRLLAVDPYWHGEEWTTPVVKIPGTLPFLSDDPDDHPWGLSASVALGADMPITVTGDVDSPATLQIIGPAVTTHITSPSGLDVSVGAVGSGQTLTVDMGRRKRVLLDGSASWNLLGDSPQWRPLPPGDTTISVVVTGATTATQARVYGTSLWETAW